MPEPLPIWVKAAVAAEPLGLTVPVLISAIEEGQLPLRAEVFGKRGMRYVLAADLTAYVRGMQHHPAEGVA